MKLLAMVGAALQQLFGPVAESLADTTGAVKRIREFRPISLAQTFVLGYLKVVATLIAKSVRPETSDRIGFAKWQVVTH